MSESLVLGSFRPIPLSIDPSIDRVLCLDSETTGLEVENGHRIITLGVVELSLVSPPADMIIQEFEWKCNPGRPSDEKAVKVHGITNEQASEFPFFADQAEEIMSAIGNKPIVIYNAAFDKGFLDAELSRVGRPPLSNQIFDALEYARAGLPNRTSATLDDMMRHFGIKDERDLHGALKDARLLAFVFRRMYDAGLSISKSYADQMHFLSNSLPIHEERDLKRPTSAELDAHEKFMQSILLKVS